MVASWFCTCSRIDFWLSTGFNIDVTKDVSGVITTFNLGWVATLRLPVCADRKVVAIIEGAACVKQ